VAVAAGVLGAAMAHPTPDGGADIGRHHADAAPHVSPRLVVTPKQVRNSAAAAAVAIAAAPAPVAAVVGTAGAFEWLQTQIANPVRTRGMYNSVHLIDIGNTQHEPREYRRAIRGRVYYTNGYQVDTPGTNRARTSVGPAQLGNELLWNTGPAAMAAPANSPAAFLVAARKYIWNAPAGTCPIGTGDGRNDDSIATMIRFGEFFFYTGGDLPSVGEELIANAVTANGFNNPQGGGAFAPAGRIAAFKCGHHGSSKSTSTQFLHTINPRAAFISCGKNTFGTGDKHPDQVLINRLLGQASINPFYLTNCRYSKIGVPASQGFNQLTMLGNRSRVSGDNVDDNKAAWRNRGNICLYLDEGESAGAGRVFHVEYWENLPNLLAPLHLGAPPAYGPTEVDHLF
jgi:hypothetical protein